MSQKKWNNVLKSASSEHWFFGLGLWQALVLYSLEPLWACSLLPLGLNSSTLFKNTIVLVIQYPLELFKVLLHTLLSFRNYYESLSLVLLKLWSTFAEIFFNCLQPELYKYHLQTRFKIKHINSPSRSLRDLVPSLTCTFMRHTIAHYKWYIIRISSPMYR